MARDDQESYSISGPCYDSHIRRDHTETLSRIGFRFPWCWRTPLSLDMDAPESRAVQPPKLEQVRKLPEVGGLPHHYERIAA